MLQVVFFMVRYYFVRGVLLPKNNHMTIVFKDILPLMAVTVFAGTTFFVPYKCETTAVAIFQKKQLSSDMLQNEECYMLLSLVTVQLLQELLFLPARFCPGFYMGSRYQLIPGPAKPMTYLPPFRRTPVL